MAASKPGTAARQRDYELEAAKAENARLSEALQETAVRLTPAGHYAAPATYWSSVRSGHTAGSPAALWGSWPTRHRADHPCTGYSTPKPPRSWALFDEWGETDRSHRKLAHRGSYLHRVWVSPYSVRRVLFLADKHFRPLPRPGRSQRKPFPEWVASTPNSIWIYDTTHFTRAKMAVLIIQDLVSRKWITEVASAEETSTQVEGGFNNALDIEGLLEAVERRADKLVVINTDDAARPILVMSDNGPQSQPARPAPARSTHPDVRRRTRRCEMHPAARS